MISRREFVMFSLVASGSCLMPRTAFADAGAVELVDSFGRAIELDAPPSEITPLGNYAQSILYSIAPTLPSFSLAEAAGAENGRSRMEEAPMPKSNGSEDFLQEDALMLEAQSASAPSMDIGSPEKSSSESLDAIEGRTCRPAMFLTGGFETLGASYRELGTFLHEEKCFEMADYIEEVVSLTTERKARLASEPARTIYVASGETGIEFETFNYLQANVFDYLNCECINNRPELAVDPRDEGSVFDLEDVLSLSPEHIVFKDVGPDAFSEQSAAVRFLWKRAPQIACGNAYCAPRTEFSWLGSPLVSQCLGALWLGAALYPAHYSDVDVLGYADRFYRLFVHSADALEDIRSALADRTVRI